MGATFNAGRNRRPERTNARQGTAALPSTRTVNWSQLDQQQPQDSISSHHIPSHPVFVVDDTFFRSRTPATPHWSIAWSDLMMTMFVLFLTLFVYQLAHHDFLSSDKVEVVGGKPLKMPLPPSASLPFYPIYPEVAENRGKVLRPVEDVQPDDTVPPAPAPAPAPPLEEAIPREKTPAAERPEPEIASGPRLEPRPLTGEEDFPARDRVPDPAQAAANRPGEDGKELITGIYDLSRITLASEKLEKFASVELIPDKTMRIILTGDLLFDSGRAELTGEARRSLRSLATIISHTPYMINVVGHTDSIPMSSERYPTNWELSTARACQVARFLMDEAGIPGSQIVVSGYSYFRPVRPNTTEESRRDNRRVEIILSREPAPAVRTGPGDQGPRPAHIRATDLYSLQGGT